jgi:hypothetical protein
MITVYAVSMLTMPTAHAGHVLVDLLTLVPVALLAAWFIFIALRERRRGSRRGRARD